MKYLFFVLFFTSMQLLNAQTSKDYQFKDFTEVSAGYGMTLTLTQGEYRVSVKADEDDFEDLVVEKNGNELLFKLDTWHSSDREIYVTIQMPDLEKLNLSGGSKGKIKMNAKGDAEFNLSGGAKVNGEFSCKKMNVELSGGASAKLTGNSEDLTADLSGGAELNFKNFKVKNVNADLSGGSRVEVTMNGKMNVQASGGSRFIHYGNAERGKISTSGGSSIESGD